MMFDVIDTKTGQYPNLERIALEEEWAQRLVYCDVSGFALSEDGCLLLTDDCGSVAFPPEGRFRITSFDMRRIP